MADLLSKSGHLLASSGHLLSGTCSCCGVCNCSTASGSPSLTVTVTSSNCPCDIEPSSCGSTIASQVMNTGVSGTYTLALLSSSSSACKWQGTSASPSAAIYSGPSPGGCTGTPYESDSGITITVLATNDPSQVASFIGQAFTAFSPALAAGEWAWIARISGFTSGPSPRILSIIEWTALTVISGCPSGSDLGPMASNAYQGSGFPNTLTTVPCGRLTSGQFNCHNECVFGECEGPILDTTSFMVTL